MTRRILAIDPGPAQSAFVVFDGARVTAHGLWPNGTLLTALWRDGAGTATDTAVGAPYDEAVFERIESFGMAVGVDVFETVFWTGRFYEATPARVVSRLGRRAVKLHLCHSARAKDSNVRQALLDRFGGATAVGTKKAPGPLYGLRSHEWAALAVAVTWFDTSPAGA